MHKFGFLVGDGSCQDRPPSWGVTCGEARGGSGGTERSSGRRSGGGSGEDSARDWLLLSIIFLDLGSL